MPVTCNALESVEFANGHALAAVADDSGGSRRVYRSYDSFHVERLDPMNTPLWALDVPVTSSDQFPYVVAAGEEDSTIIAGVVDGTMELGGSEEQGTFAFLIKLDATGQPIWWRKIDVPLVDNFAAVSVYAMATDAAGNIWVAGALDGTLTVDDATLTTSQNAFVLRADPDGTARWIASPEDKPGSAWFLSVAIDGDGNVYAGGVDNSTPPWSCNGTEATLVSFDPNGALRWSRESSGKLVDASVSSIVIDTSGVYTTGIINVDTSTAIDLGGGPIGGTDYVAKYSLDGEHLWSHGSTDSETNWLTGGHLALDPQGRLLWGTSGYNYHVRVYGADGQLLWDRAIETGTKVDDQGNAAIFVDCSLSSTTILSDGRVVLAGCAQKWVDFGGGHLASPDGGQGYFATLSP